MPPAANVSILKKFKSRLNAEWEQNPICDLHGYECPCRRRFIRTTSLYRWMEVKEDDESETNVERLLKEVNPIKVPFPASILKGEKRCVLVFCILLERDRGDLIYVFQRAGIVDEHLDISEYNLQRLKDELKEYNIPDINRITEDFERQKWAYCPGRLELCMDKSFEHQLRLPFCKREEASDKGGTAFVFRVVVHEEFVSDKLKEHLGTPFDSPRYGKVSTTDLIFCIENVIDRLQCYKLAIKSYSEHQKTAYKAEVQAYRGLADKPGMLRYFGCYSCNEQGFKRYNILLEFGTMDLLTYFENQSSPEEEAEIIRCWKLIFKIAKAIRTVHELTYGEELYNGSVLIPPYPLTICLTKSVGIST